MSIFKISTVAVALAAGIGAASAATVQSSRGTFIQDRHGAWHEYVRVSQIRSYGFNGRDEYDYGTSGQYAMVPQGRYSGGYYANNGYSYPVGGGASNPNFGILSEH
jgi:hypothetical protein